MYSDIVMDHFTNPRNAGVIEDADGVGEVGNPLCGDMMTFYIKVKDNRLEEVKFQTFGCVAAIAVSSMVSEMAMGKTLEEAMKITNEKVAAELGGLPKNKLHCSNLGADALHEAIQDFKSKHEPQKAEAPAGKKCCCPLCDLPMENCGDFCGHCQVEFEECPDCGNLTRKGEELCSHCGAEIRKGDDR
jgi:nitrogen fixation NifU-like protein